MEFDFEPVCDQRQTSFEPAGVMEFGFNGILPGAKFTLRVSFTFSCFGSDNYCRALEQWTSAKLCGMVQTTRNEIMELSLLIIFNIGRHLYSEGGHHVEHRLAFQFCIMSQNSHVEPLTALLYS